MGWKMKYKHNAGNTNNIKTHKFKINQLDSLNEM